MFNYKYGAILNTNSLYEACDQISLLEKQKYPPNSYYLVIKNNPSKTEFDTFFNLINPTGKVWKYKVVGEEIANYLIDEYFVTKSITENSVLVINGEIKKNLTRDLFAAIEQFPNHWFYKIEGHKYFYSLLCNIYTFDEVEKMLIENDNAEKIYGPITSQEHIVT